MRVFIVHFRAAVRAKFTSFALPFSAFAAYFFTMIDYTPIVFCCICFRFPPPMHNRNQLAICHLMHLVQIRKGSISCRLKLRALRCHIG